MWNPNNGGGWGGNYGPMIVEAARRNGVPPELLLAIGKTESAFDPRAVSRVGAQGMFQFMPGTARDMGLSDPFDPVASADAAARYLSQLHGQFGDWGLASAAYNAGPGNIRKWGRNPAGWVPETRNYLTKIQQILGGPAGGNGAQGQGGLLDYLDAPAVAPSAGDEDPAVAAAAGLDNPDMLNLALLSGGANILAGNTGGASLGQLLGNGLIGAVNGYGGALAAQQSMDQQTMENQMAMQRYAMQEKQLEMQMLAQAREIQSTQRQEEARRKYGESLTPEEQTRFMVDPQGFMTAYNNRQTALEKAKIEAEAKRAAGPEFADVNNLGKRYTAESAQFNEINRSFGNILNGAMKQTSAGDMAMIFGFMKSQDPGSTVREGEYATAENTRGVSESVMAAYNKAVDGQKLTPEQRQQFVDVSFGAWDQARTVQAERNAFYESLAGSFGIPVERIVQNPIPAGEKMWREYQAYQEALTQAPPPNAQSGRQVPRQYVQIPDPGKLVLQ